MWSGIYIHTQQKSHCAVILGRLTTNDKQYCVKFPHIHTHTLTLSLTYSFTHSYTLTHTLTHSLTHSLTLSLIHSHSHSHSHSFTHTLIHTRENGVHNLVDKQSTTTTGIIEIIVMCVHVNEWEWVSELRSWVSEWVRVWVRVYEWVNEYVSESVSVCVCMCGNLLTVLYYDNSWLFVY